MGRWTADDVPNLSEATVVVTGANSGIGFEASRVLLGKGARVVLACRSDARGEAAVAALQAEVPTGRAEFMSLDLSKLDSVRSFAEAFAAGHERLDVLVNNAGVMVPPFARTAEGFELQMGVNHLGHFALTGWLLPALRATPGSRVIGLTSGMHRVGRMDFEDLNWERRRYRDWAAYSQSKLANLLFHLELDRRLRSAGLDIMSVAAHPGFASTGLQGHSAWTRWASMAFAQNAQMGALPTLRAATDPQARPGDFFGPPGLWEAWGHPERCTPSAAARNVDHGQRLWRLSEELTDVAYLGAEAT